MLSHALHDIFINRCSSQIFFCFSAQHCWLLVLSSGTNLRILQCAAKTIIPFWPNLIAVFQRLQEMTRKTKSGSSQWCLVGEQEVMAVNQSKMFRANIRPFHYEVDGQASAAGCPERLCVESFMAGLWS